MEIHLKPPEKIKVRKARESDSRRIKRLTAENEKLLNILNALTTRNEELERALAEIRAGKIDRIKR
jgi:predicted RNase H-like nuclease (RuvC/YqgF family)